MVAQADSLCDVPTRALRQKVDVCFDVTPVVHVGQPMGCIAPRGRKTAEQCAELKLGKKARPAGLTKENKRAARARTALE